MRLIVGNVDSQAISGGTDNLLDFDVMQLLREYLRVRPDDYRHSEAYQDGKWDGWQYFITPKGKFATGFLPMVANYLAELGVKIILEDNRKNLPKLNEVIHDRVGIINGTPWLGRDYQVELTGRLNNYVHINGEPVYFPRGIFDAATNAGKNSIAALVINNLQDPNDEVIFMVSGLVIYKQAVAFFSDVMGEPCGEVNSKKFKPKRITVCMVTSLYNKAKASMAVKVWMAGIKVLIVDESDEAGAKAYSKCLTLVGAGMRVFISGTPLDASRVNNMVALGLSGQVLGVVTNDYLIKHGWSQKPNVRILLNYTPTLLLQYPQELKKTIHLSTNRCRLISEEILSKYPDKQTLITFIEREHGYFMYEYLKSAHPDIPMGIAHGESADRDSIIESFSSKEIRVLFTSTILKRGANVPTIQILVNSHGGKSRITVKQFTGRALRHDGIEDEVLVFDFYDVGKYVGKHSQMRIKIYEGEGFDITKNYAERRGKPIL